MGRTACTEPQCLYKGDLYLLPKVRHTAETRSDFLMTKNKKKICYNTVL